MAKIVLPSNEEIHAELIKKTWNEAITAAMNTEYKEYDSFGDSAMVKFKDGQLKALKALLR